MNQNSYLSALIGILACGVAGLPAASGQLLNPEFQNGLSGWTVQGTNTIVPFGYTGTPLNLGSAPGSVFFRSGAVIVSSDPANMGSTLVASGLSQTFALKAPNIPTGFGNGVGRLQLSTFGGTKPVTSANLSFDVRLLSNESVGAPFDYVRVELSGKPLLILEARNTGNGPGAYGFSRASGVVHVNADVSSLVGTTQTLSFFGSDTIDSSVASALAILDPQLTIVSKYVLEDIDAINSVYSTGLPVALAQRNLLLNVAFNANRDVNARLFRLRSQINEVVGAHGPVGDDGKEVKETKDVLPPEKRWAFFATGNYGYRDVSDVGDSAGFRTDLFTATVGAEYKVTPSVTLGIGATRVESDNDLRGAGREDIEGWSYDAYASYAANHFYADLLYAIGTYNHQIHRYTDFLGNTATSHPNSLTNSLQFNTGYNLQLGPLVTGPLASVNWVHGDIHGYSEQQGGNADLEVPKQNFDSLTTDFGWQLSAPVRTTFGSVTPQIRASWVREYLNDTKDLTVSLKNSPYYQVNGANVSRIGGFSASGSTATPGDDYMSVGAGVSFAIGDRASIIVDWEGHFFQSEGISQNVSLTGQIKF